MKQLAARIKPKHGYSHLLHVVLTLLIPALLFLILGGIQIIPSLSYIDPPFNSPALAVTILLLSKWRMFAVRPRYWVPNIRGNAIDLFVGISVILFMSYAVDVRFKLLWVLLYTIWLIGIKPRSTVLWVSVQAFIGQVVGLSALYIVFDDAPIVVLMSLQAIVCYYSARHFFTSFEERHSRYLSFIWTFFAASLGWVLGHLLLYYSVISQPVLILSVLGFSMGGIYYLDHKDRLSVFARRQFVFIMLSVVVVVIGHMLYMVRGLLRGVS